MESMDEKIPFFLGRPFMYESRAKIDVMKKKIQLHIDSKNIKFDFQKYVYVIKDT